MLFTTAFAKAELYTKRPSLYRKRNQNQKQNRSKESLQPRTTLPQSLLLLIPKQSPQNLPTRTLRNSIDEPNAALEPLVPSLVLLDVLFDRLRSSRIVGTGFSGLDDNGLGDFARCVVGDGDDGAVGDGRVGEEVGF